MRPTVRIGHWSVILVLCLPTAAVCEPGPGVILVHSPAPASTVDNGLLGNLEAWLDAHSDLARRPPAPQVQLISPEAAEPIVGPPGRGYGAARAFYDPVAETVFLVHPWSAHNPRDVAILLHELVHHRQVDRHYACAGAQELPAYRAQEAWLAERGLELDVNWFAIVLDAGCTPLDIHPD